MDATFPLAGLIEEFGQLLEDHDFGGAEELLSGALGAYRQSAGEASSAIEAFIHFQFGKLYHRWDKLTSSVNHLNLAAEIATQKSESLLLIQIIEELKLARKRQLSQRP